MAISSMLKLYHSVWEPPIMCVAWKISPSLGCYVDNESIPLKIQFISISKPSFGTSTNPCFPLRRAYPFTFMLSHHPLIKKHQLEHRCHLHVLLLVYIEYDLIGENGGLAPRCIWTHYRNTYFEKLKKSKQKSRVYIRTFYVRAQGFGEKRLFLWLV